jgi:hypothetical protein
MQDAMLPVPPRRLRALVMRLQGATYEAIAKALHTHKPDAARMVMGAVADLRPEPTPIRRRVWEIEE